MRYVSTSHNVKCVKLATGGNFFIDADVRRIVTMLAGCREVKLETNLLCAIRAERKWYALHVFSLLHGHGANRNLVEQIEISAKRTDIRHNNFALVEHVYQELLRDCIVVVRLIL
jgi:hypothetical protein